MLISEIIKKLGKYKVELGDLDLSIAGSNQYGHCEHMCNFEIIESDILEVLESGKVIKNGTEHIFIGVD